MQQYCLYLRKSREDSEAELRGEGETLARHEKALLDLAKRQHLNITQIYKEIVSGETIASRPVMQSLLSEVEQGIWTGVLVMEVERLARGDTIDQGIMSQTFKISNTKIITPMKTYDPNNEFDEEYFEFGLFMSRREYKTINRRLQRGRIASVKEGKYVANQPPYGYDRVKLEHDKGFTLSPNDGESNVIKMIFEWYTKGVKESDGTYNRIGISLIARRLNDMKIPSKKGGTWSTASIRDILINPVYIGKIRWNWRPSVKKIVDGQITKERPRSTENECIIVDGLHPAIVDEKIFNLAQGNIKTNRPNPVVKGKTTKNPLSGLVICGKCGKHMVRRPYNSRTKTDTIMCQSNVCDNISSYLPYVEESVLNSLSEWVREYKLKWGKDNTSDTCSEINVHKIALKKIEEKILIFNKQIDNLHDLLEQGIYSSEMFLERNRILSKKLDEAINHKKEIKAKIDNELLLNESKTTIIPKIENLLKVYHTLPNAQEKNRMLKEVLEKVTYVKDRNGRWHNSPDDFEIIIYPKLPTK